jgi:hypothetical protein
MRRTCILALLFPTLIALAVPVGSQTRPRRVTQPADTSQPANTSSVSSSETRTQERERTARARTPEIREGQRRESRWPAMLLGTAISIGASRGHGSSCSPSRGVLLGGPR